MGGSFDPVHVGHLAIADAVLRLFNVDFLWFIPAKISPLKRGSMVAGDEDRLTMLRLATCHNRRFGISDCELKRGGVSFTIDTLRRWKALEPDAELIFPIGMDSLLSLWRWKNPLEAVRLCRFVTFRRPGSAITPKIDDLKLPVHIASKLLSDIVDAPLLDVSSSQIRERIVDRHDTSAFLHPSVLRYIRARNLYIDGAE